MKKVLILTYYWPPSGGAGVQRVLKFVKYLPGFGIRPYVVTVKEDEASYPVIDQSLSADIPPEAVVFRTSTSEPFNLYSKVLGRKSIPTGFSNESKPGAVQKFSRFIRGNFFIPDARKGWMQFAVKKASEVLKTEKIDTIISTGPPHSVHLAAMRLKNEFGVKWIADMRDPWTDIYYYNEFKHLPFAKKADKNFEREVLETADKIITVSNSLKELFAGKSSKIDSKKIFVIPNGFDESDFINCEGRRDSGFVITYTGTLSESYNPFIFFDCLKMIVNEHREVNFKLRFVGNIASAVIEKIRSLSLSENLELIPTVSHEESVSYLFRSTILLLIIPEVSNDKGILTGKLFEYLAARKPVICIGPEDGDAAKIIKECNSGNTFSRSNQEGLSAYLQSLISKWKSGNTDVENENYKKYSRYNQAKELAQIIETN